MLVISSLRRGGAERVVSIMANYWVGNGHDVFLATIEGRGVDAYSVNPAVRRVALNLARVSRNPFSGLWSNLRRVWRLQAVMRRTKPDVIVSFVTHTNLLMLIAMSGSRVPVVVAERIDPAQIYLGKVREKLRVWLYPRAAVVAVQTSRVRDEMRSLMPSARFAVIPNPVPEVNPDEHQPNITLHEQVKLPPGTKVAIAMGRLDPQKGFDLLLEAFSKLSSRYAPWHLVIFGEGPTRFELEAQAKRLGLVDRVHLPGIVYDSRRALAGADLFILSSRFEGFPNVLLEAMACGRAVASFDCPSGPGDIIRHGYDGLLVEAGNVAGLVAAMSELMGSSETRERLGRNARQITERFSVNRVMTLWDALLESAALRGSVRHVRDV